MFRHTRLPSHLSIAALFVCAAAFLFSIRFGPPVSAQIDPTSQQGTMDALVATQFAAAQTATAQAEQLNLLPNSVTETPNAALQDQLPQIITATPSGISVTASGSTIVVNSLDDDPRGCPRKCTFRSAVLTAKSGDTIAFDPTLAGTIILAQPITLDKDLTIVGTENDQIIFAGKDAQITLLVVDISVRVTVSHITFRDAEGSDQSGVNSRSAINSQGTVVLTDVRFERSSLYTSGMLEAQRVTFTGNQSLALFVSGTALIQDSAFSNASVSTNGAYSAYGTGCLISNRGNLVLENVLIEDNICDG
ncbi:MAG: hypothetical protein JNM70_19275, partial [Anaerolineae bacterium]|nr:hypothetical protein [Anaerolineae bacterium]